MAWLGARRNPVPAIVVAVIGLVVILVLQGVPVRHRIEQDLTKRSVDALAEAGVAGAQVTFTGRDGVVHVVSPADAARAGDVVRGRDGVRVVRVVAPLTSPSPGPGATPLKAPAVTLAVNAGKVTLTGAVPSEQVKTTLGDSATATFGAGAVDNQLTVDAQVGADGLSGLGGVLDGLGKDAQGAAVSLADGVITLTGTVGSAAAKQAAVGAAGQVAGSADRVRDQLTVVAPPAPPAQVQNKLSSLPPIGFLTGSATLSPSGRTAVAQVAAVLNANPSTRIRIEGHTDDVGDASRNLVLSRSRAAVVLNTLRAGGVAADRMTSTGFGEARPKVRGTSEAARATNRRVEFIVV